MNLLDLAESHVLSITQDQARLWIEFVVLAEDNNQYQIFATNSDGTPIVVAVGALSVRAGFTTAENVPSLGELETICLTPDGVLLEGDFGDFTITADSIHVGKKHSPHAP